MTLDVLRENEVALNDVKYPIIGDVTVESAAVYPDKIVLGDYGRDSQKYRSAIEWRDWRGGVGLETVGVDGRGLDRAWWSECQLLNNHLVLPQLETSTGTPEAGGITTLIDHDVSGDRRMFATAGAGNDVWYYANGTTWTDSTRNLGANATDVVTFKQGGGTVEYLVYALGTTGFEYDSDGTTDATWATNAKDTIRLATWDRRLWGISAVGQLWYLYAVSATEADCVDDAKIDMPTGYTVNGLFVGPHPQDPSREILYASTEDGLYAHDHLTPRFVKVLPLPHRDNAGDFATTWRGDVFMNAGRGIYRLSPSGQQMLVTAMGPDRDDGMPTANRGDVRRLLNTHNYLIAFVDATQSGGKSSILGYNGKGWEVLWVGDTATKAFEGGTISTADGTYRLWWAYNDKVYKMDLQSDLVNPRQVTDNTRRSTATHETPWFDAGQYEIEKVALELVALVEGLSADETIKFEYALDYSSSYESGPSPITGDGVHRMFFPGLGTGGGGSFTGDGFRSIKFRFTLLRGSTTTKTPDLLSVTLQYLKKLPSARVFTFDIDLSRRYLGVSVENLRANLQTAMDQSTLLIELHYRDASKVGVEGTRDSWGHIYSIEGTERTGHNETGRTRVRFVEIIEG